MLCLSPLVAHGVFRIDGRMVERKLLELQRFSLTLKFGPCSVCFFGELRGCCCCSFEFAELLRICCLSRVLLDGFRFCFLGSFFGRQEKTPLGS
jgi:hypothetical protein